MKVLVACEFSGRVRDAFQEAGHHAWSCDLLDSETPGNHYRGDVRNILGWAWDLMICHPPCTYLAKSGARWHMDSHRERADALDLCEAPPGCRHPQNCPGEPHRQNLHSHQEARPDYPPMGAWAWRGETHLPLAEGFTQTGSQ